MAVLAYLAMALRPFELDLPRLHGPNRLVRLAGGGVRLAEPSTARTRSGPAVVRAAVSGRRLSVELDLTARRAAPRRPAPILSITTDPYRTNLVVAQEGDDLVVGVRGPARRAERVRRFRVRDVFARPGRHLVRIDADDRELTAAVDGVPRLTRSMRPHGFGSWLPDARIVLGHDGGDDPGWEGDVRRAAVEAGPERVDLLAPGILRAPDRWWHLPAKPPAGRSRNLVADITLNLLGFVPFGALVSLVTRRRRVVATAAVGALLLSASMELGQLFVVPRDPSVRDLVVNVVGAAAGASLARRVRTPGAGT